jgi:hypothetical protein
VCFLNAHNLRRALKPPTPANLHRTGNSEGGLDLHEGAKSSSGQRLLVYACVWRCVKGLQKGERMAVCV